MVPGRRDSNGEVYDGTDISRCPCAPGRLPMPEMGKEDMDEELKAVAKQMRDIFGGRIGISDQHTVALICGGHTYGRCHPDITGY